MGQEPYGEDPPGRGGHSHSCTALPPANATLRETPKTGHTCPCRESSHLGKVLDPRRAKCEPDLPAHSAHPPGLWYPEPLSAKRPSVWKSSLLSLCSPNMLQRQFLHCFLWTRVQRTYSLNARGALTRRGLLRESRALSKALSSGRWGKGAPETSARPSRFCSLLG